MSQVASPCVNICKLVNNICKGCSRTIEEISNWTRYSDSEKKLVLELIKIRNLKKEH